MRKKQFTGEKTIHTRKNNSHEKKQFTREKTQFTRGRDAERDFFLSRCRWTSQHIRSQEYSLSQVHMSKQLKGCENNNTQAESRIDTKITDSKCATEFTRLVQATVFHILCRDHHEITAPPLV